MSNLNIPLMQRFRIHWLALFYCVFVIGNAYLVAITGQISFFVLTALPIVSSGWFFSGRRVLFVALFVVLISVLSLQLFNAPVLHGQDVVRGFLIDGCFACVGVFVAKLREKNRQIQQLNWEMQNKNRELAELSLHDYLTRLYNRRYVNEIVFELAGNFLNRLIHPEAQKRDISIQDKVIVVFMVDIDGFKAINDTYGHSAGDRVLVELSDRLRNLVRFDDIVARWGGEEFLVVCPMVRKDSVGLIVRKIAEGLRHRKYTLTGGLSIEVTVSIGCLCYPLFAGRPALFSFEEAIGLCDAALYYSKENGRNRATYVVPRDDAPVAKLGRGPFPYRSLIQDSSLFTLEIVI